MMYGKTVRWICLSGWIHLTFTSFKRTTHNVKLTWNLKLNLHITDLQHKSNQRISKSGKILQCVHLWHCRLYIYLCCWVTDLLTQKMLTLVWVHYYLCDTFSWISLVKVSQKFGYIFFYNILCRFWISKPGYQIYTKYNFS